MGFVIPRLVYDVMVKHCDLEKPIEACGVLSGKAGIITRCYPVANKAKSSTRYEMEPEDQLRVMTDVGNRGEDLIAIYHSHPDSPAYPSPTDIRLAYYPDSYYVIVSLVGAQPEVRAFRIASGAALEIRIQMGA